MEFTLHKQLKQHYCGVSGQTEVKLGRYRIDAVVDDLLFEVQLGSLGAIRDKIRNLTKGHQVVVVKPLVTRKRLVKLSKKNGKIVEQRWSPKRETILSIFDELIYFTRAFPHPNLTLEVPLVTVEETRFPGNGKRRRRRKNAFQILDRTLGELQETMTFQSTQHLTDLLPETLPDVFDTGILCKHLNAPRWMAQRIAYCMRHMGAFVQVGKKGNAWQYRMVHAEDESAATNASQKSSSQPRAKIQAA